MGSAFCFVVRFGTIRVDLIAASSTVEEFKEEFKGPVPKEFKGPVPKEFKGPVPKNRGI